MIRFDTPNKMLYCDTKNTCCFQPVVFMLNLGACIRAVNIVIINTMLAINWQMLYFTTSLCVADPYTLVTFIAHNISEGISLIKTG